MRLNLLDVLAARDVEHASAAGDPEKEALADRSILLEILFDGDLGAITAAGFPLQEHFEGFASGFLTPRQIRDLSELPSIRALRLPGQGKPTLDKSIPQIKADFAWGKGNSIAAKGKGAVIGVIDTGIDVRHPAFLKTGGTSRVLKLWDQTFAFGPIANSVMGFDKNGDVLPYDVTDETGGTNVRNRTPVRFGFLYDYGIEFDQRQINVALANPPTPFPVALGAVRDGQDPFHGTASAGIAAGGPAVAPAAIYSGVAPEADLIIVRTDLDTAKLVHAAEYIIAAAKEAAPDKPVVINCSFGHSLAPHNGHFTVASAFDDLMRSNSHVLFVIAAGNERDDRIHAADPLVLGDPAAKIALRVTPAANNKTVQKFLVFGSCAANSTILCKVKPPFADNPTAQKGDWLINGPSAAESAKVYNSHRVALERETSDSGDPDTHFIITIEASRHVQAGLWTLELSSQPNTADGNVHLWIDDGNGVAFVDPTTGVMSAQDQTRLDNWIKATVSATASCSGAVVVGAYDAEEANFPIASFSSQGPSPRNLSAGLYSSNSMAKPDIAAPGVSIDSPRPLDKHSAAAFFLANYDADNGTSEAAPHVAGVAALIWSQRPTLANWQVKTALTQTARGNATARYAELYNWWHGWGGHPGNPDVEKELFGSGMVDAEAAVLNALSLP